MMKTTTMAALAVLMLAQAAPAAAQERERRSERGAERTRERPPRAWSERARPAPQAPAAPEARAAPQARRAREASPDQADLWRSDRQRGERRRADGPVPNRPGRWVDDDGDGTSNLSAADRADREDRREAREWRQWNGGERLRDGQPRRDGPDRADRRDGRDWNGRWDRNDRDRWDRHDRDRDRRRGDRSYWSRGRYPFAYHSTRRYRGPSWIAPPGFYMRSWSYGDYLPYGWYGQGYRLNDWWSYGLPWPPPGFDWVRVGPDVLLVDRYTGQVVQVVRMVFW